MDMIVIVFVPIAILQNLKMQDSIQLVILNNSYRILSENRTEILLFCIKCLPDKADTRVFAVFKN